MPSGPNLPQVYNTDWTHIWDQSTLIPEPTVA